MDEDCVWRLSGGRKEVEQAEGLMESVHRGTERCTGRIRNSSVDPSV